VEKQRKLLANSCRKGVRILWRDDGCCIDWVLKRDEGAFTAFWPEDLPFSERELWGRSQAVSVKEGDPEYAREITNVRHTGDGVEIRWKRIPRLVSPRVLGNSLQLLI
jgi:hypothetical protein